MNGFIKFSLNNKFAVWILTVIVIFAGLYSGMTMKMETIPDIEIPIVIVTTIHPGASPDEVLNDVTLPVEQRLRNLSGVNVVNSTSMENASNLILEYDYSKDMKEAVQEIKETLAEMEFPAGVQTPSVSRIQINAFPVISLSAAYEGKTLTELTEWAETEALIDLQAIDGIANVQIAGQYMEEVSVKFDEQRMSELGLSLDTVKGIIQASAVTFPLGLQEMDETEVTLLLDGNVRTLDDLKSVAIPVIPTAAGMPGGQGAMGMPGAPGMQGAEQLNPQASHMSQMAPEAGSVDMSQASQAETQLPDGAGAMPEMGSFALPTVQLSDIADIELIGKAESISRTNGKPSLGIQIVKGADANTVDVVNAVKAQAKEWEEKHQGLELIAAFDQGEPIEQSVQSMLSKALFGALFAVIIILLFLRNIRTTLISIISIPLSLLIALLILNQMDITLNIMTLGALTVAIGRVVDDSIVVIENIYRRMSLKGEELKGKALVLESTKEMFIPIFSSTIVTIAVFLPMALVTGPVGQLFIPFALAVVFALLASLLVAVTLVPLLAHSLFKKELHKERTHGEDRPGVLAAWYRKVLTKALDHKALTFSIAVLLLVGSLFLAPVVGFSFLPSEGEKMMMITYNGSPGQRAEDVEALMLDAEEVLLAREGVQLMQFSVGGGNPMAMGMGSSSKSALFFVQYDEDFPEFDQEKLDVLEELQALSDQGEWKQQDFADMGMGGSKLSLYVYGPDFEQLEPAAEQIVELLQANKDLINVTSSVSETYDQYRLVANQQKLSEFGLTAAQIGMELMPVRERPVLTTVREDGKDIKVYIEEEGREISSRAELENMAFLSPLGFPVSLQDVVDIEEETSPNNITRRDNRVYVELSADITAKDVRKVSDQINKEIEQLGLPSVIDVQFGGVTEQMNESFTQLGLAMAAAVAIVYFILVVTFGGGLAPFTILFSLPFTIIGALVGLWIAGETISVSALIGALMLIGIVVTNAIVMIDRVIRKEKEGLSTREALLEGAVTRLRPILMTAFATVGALMPLALGFDSTEMISKGLGITVIGGLISSTLLTLVIVPIVYEFLMKFRKKQFVEE